MGFLSLTFTFLRAAGVQRPPSSRLLKQLMHRVHHCIQLVTGPETGILVFKRNLPTSFSDFGQWPVLLQQILKIGEKTKKYLNYYFLC